MNNPQPLHDFVANWTGKGYEKGESQPFWLALLHALGVDDPTQYISFEQQVHIDHTAFIDGFITATKVLVEQKSITKELGEPIKQSDGSHLTPFQQAKRYAAELPYSNRPRWIVTCNFREFWVYDMEQPNAEPEKIRLENLEKEYYRLQFLVEQQAKDTHAETQVSVEAGRLIGRIYDLLQAQYHDPNSAETLRYLNILCVRLVFCLYSEDAGVFAKRQMFGDYLRRHRQTSNVRKALRELFEVFDTPEKDRDPYMDDDLMAFPYVSGGLFADRTVVIPNFTDELTDLLIDRTSYGVDWSEISPTIFGAVFESTLNPDTRRSGGMHYTSVENIHKVIDPLFMDELSQEFEQISGGVLDKKKITRLDAFQDKLASLSFFDPACGSGNFLTETYLSLRRLENEVIKCKLGGQMIMGDIVDPIKVKIDQFYGIEINDFAVTVAQTALWIAEAQMMIETEKIVHKNIDFLPLKSYAHVVEGNALRTDWATIVPADQLNYIMGNPPFVGFTFETAEQKADMELIFPGIKNLDFVCAWYKKASDMMQGTNIKSAFVSTNSITQGETVPRFWPHLNIHIDFAYQTFRWDSESNQKAHVHCVIIGFSRKDAIQKNSPRLYCANGTYKECKNINAYLMDADDIIVDSRNKPLCNVPTMIYGNKPADGGNLIIEESEYEEFVQKEPNALKWIHPLLGATEYINNKKRYCLWLVGISPSELKSMPLVFDRVRKCKEARGASIAAAIRKFAETPTLFAQCTQPEEVDFVIVPRVTSENRKYVPIGFIDKQVKVTDAVQIIPSATLYHFGVLTSGVHMAWMRAVCGRLEMRYRYSKDIVYNNFPWPTPTAEQQAKIEQTAQAILDARNLYPDCSLADLYDEVSMPVELRRAHQDNDRAVMAAYGFGAHLTEPEIVARLLQMYQQLTHPS